MKKGLYNLFQFVISLTLGLLFAYIGFGFVLWESDVSSWAEDFRAMCVVFGVIAAGPFYAMLFSSEGNAANDDKSVNKTIRKIGGSADDDYGLY